MVLEGEFDKVIYLPTNIALQKIGKNFIDCVIGVSYINYLLELESLEFLSFHFVGTQYGFLSVARGKATAKWWTGFIK